MFLKDPSEEERYSVMADEIKNVKESLNYENRSENANAKQEIYCKLLVPHWSKGCMLSHRHLS